MIIKKCRWLIVLCVLVLMTARGMAMPHEDVRHVLVLNSYHETYHWTDRLMGGIKEVFSTRDDVRLYVTYMDTKRISGETYFEALRDLYAQRYKGIQFDAIISSDDHALNFLLSYRDDLFPEVPVFFMGVNDFKSSRIYEQALFTGVYERADVVGTIDMMLRAHPSVRRVVSITDDTLSGEAFFDHLKHAKLALADRVELDILHAPTQTDLKTILSKLPEDTLVLWGHYIRTPDGTVLTSKTSVERITRISTVPVYCIWDVVGYGVVGGKITLACEQGESVARMASRYLDGVPFEELPIEGSHVVNAFDFQQLHHWGISEDLLPQDRVILNRPSSMYEDHKAVIWRWIGGMLTLLIVIIFLVHYIFLKQRAERKLAIANEQLAQARKMEAIGQFAGGIAHDFNNLLVGISGSAELLAMTVTDEDQNFVEMIQTLSDQAAQLTAKLLAFGRKGNVALVPLDLHQVIKGVVHILRVSLRHEITVTSNLDALTAAVLGDETQITNALLNMGINAEHAIAGPGKLTFSTYLVDLDEQACCESEFELIPARYIAIEVCDTGVGIDPANLSRIFEPFYSTKGSERGTGLGLASVYGTLCGHHGAVTVRSEIDQGTTFKLLIPLCNEAELPTLDVEEDARSFGSRLILLVDDEPFVRTTASRMLIDMGYRVLIAKSGQESVDLYRENSDDIDLVLMDLVMAEMSGRKAAALIREINPESKIILSSGFIGGGAVREETRHSLTRFMQQPYRQRELEEAVAELLEKSGV